MGLSPKRRRRFPRRWSEGLDDLYDYYEAAPRQRTVRRTASAPEPIRSRTIAELTGIRDQAKGDAERAVAHIERICPEVTSESLRTFALAARRKLRHEDGTYARNHIRAVAQRVDVFSKTDVRIRGSRTELPRTLTAVSGVEAAVLWARGSGPKWCTYKRSFAYAPRTVDQ